MSLGISESKDCLSRLEDLVSTTAVSTELRSTSRMYPGVSTNMYEYVWFQCE